MSTTIDEKVVEMRFDNSHFEKNTAQTMSTLEKLKQKLNLTGASKGLENINTAANKVNMSGMAGALDTVHSKFSAMEIIGVTALANITNSAVNAGKRIVKALTIDPVMDGWQEYEMTLNAVQTTMAGTGKTAKEVEEQLKLLDEYADKTVYSTADMLNNLPKFTNAGVKLEDATTAMIGIANATALAGGDAGKASIAFYNLGQAIGTGYLTRMDYNSINNAGIATMEWKNQMVEAAIAAGTLKKVGEDQYKAGNKTLTLQQLFIDGLQEQWATTDVMMKVFKDYGDETTEIGKKSYSAAQDIKTFSMMMDSLKATAGTGWKDTWQTIFGGLDEAKEFWTGLTNFISNIITGMADFRNGILEKALGSPFGKIAKTLSSITDPIKNTVDTVSTALEDLDKMVNQVIRGDWGNGEDRFEALTKAGHNYYAIQNKVNETLGDSFRYSDEVVNSYKKLNKTQEEGTEAEKKSIKSKEELLAKLAKMSEAELRAAGYTEEQIEAIKELKKYAEMTGLSIEDLVKNLDDFSGRWLLINSFKNIGQGLVSVFTAFKDAWKEVFFGTSDSDTVISKIADGLFKLIAAFHKFTTYLTVSDRGAQNLKDTFKGLFSILDIFLTIIGGPIKLGLKILGQLFKALDITGAGVLELTGGIGRAITSFHDWLEGLLDFSGVFEFLAPLIKAAAGAVKEWFKGLGQTETVKKLSENLNKLKESLQGITANDVINFFKSLGKAIKDLFGKINEHFNGVPGDILSGLVNGLKDGAGKVIEGIVTLANNLINAFKNILGIHSPSTVFFAIGGFIIAGLIGGLLAGETSIGETISGIAGKIAEFFGNIDWSKIFSAGMSIGLLALAKKLTDIISNITAPFAGVGDLMSGVGEVLDESAKSISKVIKNTAKVVKSFAKVLSGFAFKQQTEGIKNLAISLLILVGAIAILTLLDIKKAWNAVGIILALSAILGVLAFAMNKISQASFSISKEGVKASGVKSALLSIGLALLAMAAVVKMLGGMEPDQMKQGFIGLAGAVVALGALIAAYGFLIKGKGAQNMDKAGKMIRKIATSLLLMAVVVKLVSFLDYSEMGKGVVFLAGFTAFVWALMFVTKGADKNIDKVGKTILKISIAMLLMVGVIKLISGMDWNELGKGAIFAAGVVAFVGALVAVAKIDKGNQIAKIGGTILGISIAMLLMVGVIKLISMMSWDSLAKGAIGILALGGIIAGLMYMVKIVGPEAPKLAATLVAMGIAIGILAAVAIVLSLINLPGLIKGIAAVSLLASFMALMIYATKDAKDVQGSLIVMAVAIGIMAAAVAVLSFIDWKKLLPATAAMGTLMGMFALIESQAKHVTASLGCLLVMTAVIGVLAFVLYKIAQLPIEQSLGASLSISILLLSLAGVVKILSTIGPMATAAYPAMAALAALLGGLLVVVAILGAINLIPGVKEFLSGGIDILVLLAEGIGRVIGAIIGGIGAQMSSYLPEIATNLSLFMTGLTPFIVGAKMIDESVLKGIGIISAAIIALTAAELINGVASFLTGGSSFAELGTQLSQFMVNAMPFVLLSRQIDPAIMEGVKTLAEAILIITGTNLLESLTSFITGGSSLENFATQLPILGTGLNNFITAVGPITAEQVETAQNAANIIKTLAQAAQEIPNTGGLLAQLVGDNDMGAWAMQLPIMGTGIASFIKIITDAGIDSSAVETANTAAQVIKTLAQAASEIPNTGGLLASLIGDNDLASFASQLPNVGKGIVGFIQALTNGEITADKAEVANTAASVIKTLAAAAQEIPNTGGLLAGLVGDNDLSQFAAGLPKVGQGIAGFANELGTFGPEQLNTVIVACLALEKIVDLANIDIEQTGDDMEELGKNLVAFAKKFKEFTSKMTEVGGDSITAAIDKTKEVIEFASTISNTNVESLKTFAEALKDVAKEGVKKFVDELSGEDPKADAKKSIGELLDAAIDGAEDKSPDVEDAFEKIAEDAADALYSSSIEKSAKQAGKDLVSGFALGITNNKYLARDAGSEVGKAALKAAKQAIDSNSPSKEAMKIGNFFGEGFAIGIRDYASTAYDASYSVADRAKTGLSKAISRVSDLINSGMDDQLTIRPVLDLSDVESGVGYLSSMLNNGPSVGVMANLGAISSGMNTRNQNGANDDVVSAIDKLRKNLGDTKGDTYNINGVTYDDGSNITNAVKTLVRAAKIERRV